MGEKCMAVMTRMISTEEAPNVRSDQRGLFVVGHEISLKDSRKKKRGVKTQVPAKR
jgi:hypothetical protein